MACFVVPAAEAIVTTAATKILKKKENKAAAAAAESAETVTALPAENKIHFSARLNWLNNMLWGGSALLCFEHIWHGEVVPTFPFLSAMSNSADTAEMLHEMGTVGVTMALVVTAVWAGMVAVSNVMEKKVQPAQQEEEE